MWQNRIVNWITIVSASYGVSYVILQDNAVTRWLMRETPIQPIALAVLLWIAAAAIQLIFKDGTKYWEHLWIPLLPTVFVAFLIVMQIAGGGITNPNSPPQHLVGHIAAAGSVFLAWQIAPHMDELIEQNNALRREVRDLKAEKRMDE